MSQIGGFHHVSLSVTDLVRSTDWYAKVLGLDVIAEVEGDGFRRVRLRAPGGVTVSLTCHEGGPRDEFSERRSGLDHLAFQLVDGSDLEAVKARLEALGIDHSEIKRHGSSTSMITLRDPDNIQLEIFG